MRKNLSLVQSALFDDTMCDFWQDKDGNIFMTINQLAKALGYTSRDAIEKMMKRDTYLNEKQFSVTDKLSATDGKHYQTRIFTEDGIYEVSMLSHTERGRLFRAWVRGIIKRLRSAYERFEDELIHARHDYPQLCAALEMVKPDIMQHDFINEANMINRIVVGMDAKHFREAHGLADKTSIRPYMTAEQIDLINRLQTVDVGLVVAMFDYEARKKRLADVADAMRRKKIA